jgi:hypothetical protein
MVRNYKIFFAKGARVGPLAVDEKVDELIVDFLEAN